MTAIPETMSCVEIAEPGGPEVLQSTTRPVPEPGQGKVLIAVRAAGVNRPDCIQRQGHYAPPPGVTDIPGLEVAGVIAGRGKDVEGWNEGDEVCALVAGGGYAQYVVAPAPQCLTIPGDLGMVEAAALPETCFTVWSNVFERGALKPGETLLIQGGSSGIGVTAIQMAVARGHRVFATAGSAAKVAACEALGAEKAILYREQDFVASVRSLTDGRGVDVILDMVGGDYLPRELACLADDGRIVLIGLLGGSQAPSLPLAPILMRRLSITGSTLRPRSPAYKAQVAAALRAEIWPLIEAGRMRPVIQQTFPLSAAAAAHQLMASGTHIGKIILTVRP